MSKSEPLGTKSGDAFALNKTTLPLVALNTPVFVAEVRALHIAEELLIVGDDNELEIALAATILNNLVQTPGE